MEVTNKQVTYKAKGFVHGNYWGGGEGAYPSRPLKSDSREELMEKAKKGLDGSLDSGMGYQSLIGALIEVTEVTTVEINGKEFINEESELEFIGDLNEEQTEFLLDVYYNN